MPNSPSPTRPPRRRTRLPALCLLGMLAITTPMVDTAQAAGSAAMSPTHAPDKAAIEAIVAPLARDLLLPGVVVLLHTPGGEVIVRHGHAARNGNIPVSDDMFLRVGSNTKTWIGTAILQLAQEGQLKLEDPVSTYLPGVPNGEHITIEQLLNMRSGLYNYTESLELNQALDEQPQRVWQPEALTAMAFKHPPYFPPDQGFHYSNTNTILLGMIASQRDNKPLPAVLHDRLFKPLGLKNTYLPEASDHTLREPYAHGYAFGSNVLTMKDPALPAEMQAAARAGRLQPTEQTLHNPSWGGAAGAGISTAADLRIWVEALAEGRLLKPEMQARRMASPRPIDPDNPDSAAYGLAIAKFGPMYGHTGELPGYNTFMGHDPVKHITLIVWANLAPAVDGRDPASTIAKALIGQLYKP